MKVRKLVERMDRSIPDSIVTGYAHLIDSLDLPDRKDRHVLAAAIVGHADTIVTFNLKDFPTEILDQFGVEAVHPDDFLLNQLGLRPVPAFAAIKKMRARYNKPPKTVTELADMLERSQLPLTAARLRQAAELI